MNKSNFWQQLFQKLSIKSTGDIMCVADPYTRTKERIDQHFRRLKRNLQIGMVIAYLIPLGLLSVYFHFQFHLSLKESGKVNLTTIAESQQKTIDLFLQERVVNIFNLFHYSQFKLSPSADDMRLYLENLRQMSDAYVDVGFLNSEGIQIGYSGPHYYLLGKDYSREGWFETLMHKGQNYHISDIYLGFRQKPHFTISVKQLFGQKFYIMRATLDPDMFYSFLRTIRRSKEVNTAVINREGKYQLVSSLQGKVLEDSFDHIPLSPTSAAYETSKNHVTSLVAYSWLQEVPWVLVVKQPLNIAYAEMYRARRILIQAIIIVILLIFLIIWLTTEKLMRRAQRTEEERGELQSQLIHAGKLISVGELAAGIAHEINNPLQIISAESGVIKDMLDPEFKLDHSPDKILSEIEVIDDAVFRARDITQKLLRFSRRSEPHLHPADINRILAQVVDGFVEKELQVSNIELIRDFEDDLPPVFVDLDQIRQVFLNMINNATDAIQGAGEITLGTRRHNNSVRVSISDTGKGMTKDQMERVFLPFFTTKEEGKGTGLGLSISLSIIEAMGGHIEVQSMLNAGSSFTVILPIPKAEENTND
ncbi:ATP-binding protein [candidate division CSSED10-310 bacterium]|uniref:histidine kinase n=1 Tax=candidate division CSSED10-310 bacterium TaxID=2855610 RepID=A0ABV6YT26_UNCC1